MAQVEQKESANGRPKKSTRIDMTAMVDVAFLLLTFFILTTTLMKPTAMELALPVDDPNSPKPIACSKMMQIYLGENDKIYWFPACEPDKIRTTDYSPSGIRNAIFQMKRQVEDLIISIKPSEVSRFANVVDILDEMKITGAKKYALSSMMPADKEILSFKGLK